MTTITTTDGTWTITIWTRPAQPCTLTADAYEGPAAFGGYCVTVDGDLVGYCASPLEAAALVADRRGL